MPLFTNCGPQVDASWCCAASCGRTRTATARSPSAMKWSAATHVWSTCEAPTEPLALLADVWLATATALEEAAFVHGDLAPDNLIVRPDGSIALIDLDTATWPTFADTRAPAVSNPAY